MSVPDLAAYETVRSRAGLFDVSDRGKIELTGADAARFLHNLCTNDILNLAVASGCEAFFCTAKAKVVAHTLVYRTPHSFWLDTEAGTATKLMQHLDRYLISEQVELADRTAEFAQFHLAGPEAHAILSAAAGTVVPSFALHHHAAQQLGETACFVRRSDALGLPGYDILSPRESGDLMKKVLLNAGAPSQDATTYDVLRVEAGTPVFGIDIDEDRFVVEVGRIKQAICYTKGCYLGQEPIVMARDRGHVNRTLTGVKLSGEGSVAAGTKLLHDGAEVGQVTSSVVSPRLGPIGLAYLRRGSWEAGTRLQTEGATRQVEVVGLPFSES
jgi:folate-binding protein YgfZ